MFYIELFQYIKIHFLLYGDIKGGSFLKDETHRHHKFEIYVNSFSSECNFHYGKLLHIDNVGIVQTNLLNSQQ